MGAAGVGEAVAVAAALVGDGAAAGAGPQAVAITSATTSALSVLDMSDLPPTPADVRRESTTRASQNGDVRALVLGGGGVTGIAWEIGVLAGLLDAGVDLGTADVVIGTSAGSLVGALATTGSSFADLYQSQLLPPASRVHARIGYYALFRFMLAARLPGDDRTARARVGRLALAARTRETAEQRLAVFRGLIGGRAWPERRLLVTAVDADTGEPRVFDRDASVPLAEAVAASCAVPMVWPPITIAGHRYIDGGVRSIANADLAQGAERVVVIAPITRAGRPNARIDRQLASLGPAVRSTIVSPDAASRLAIGRNVLDAARRAGSARAGHAHAGAIAHAVREVWG